MAESPKIKTLSVQNLLAFKQLSLGFSPGITVLIGENSTGKTQILKLCYGLLRSLRDYLHTPQPEEGKRLPHVTTKLTRLFRPDNDQIGRLVHRSVGRAKGQATLKFGSGGYFRVGITTVGKVTRKFSGSPPQVIYIPSREVLSIYPGFAAAYEQRELSFDETYYDLIKALSATPLRGPRSDRAKALILPLLKILGGRVVLAGTRFVLQSKIGNIEAPLMSEGFRKIAALAHLVANGSLDSHSVLIWDEPEANLNPKLVTVVSGMLQSLARNGVQVIIATHDFLLTQELSLAAEYKSGAGPRIKFVALSRQAGTATIVMQEGDTLAALADNPILAEFAAHYGREQQLFIDSGPKPVKADEKPG